MTLKMWRETAMVFCIVVITSAEDYESNLTKLWSLSGVKNSGTRTAVVNVTSALNVESERAPRRSKEFEGYRFRPRAIPLKEPTRERSVYYTPDNKYKSEVLFPGNYFAIAEEKSKENLTQDAYNPLEGGPFQPIAIPLKEYQGRSLGEYEEPIIEKPEGFTEQTAQRRSISYLFGIEGAEDDEDDGEDVDGEYEAEEQDGQHDRSKTKIKPKKPKTKKLGKYMMPLLLAYKMKYFAMIPLMVAGLVLLVGATGLAGFFFALFAATMGLQKGSY
ncbi:uncharacterized protein LOC133529750 [Cydia pomonella]|uniref:uncharacterized protein LOC133529750 n=1 Tax=Cydia pomonella TaxID=82600 RepID=UPI002ADD9AE6|nr:uncharacterized protein LOC133529750 [Cydia pomonella]